MKLVWRGDWVDWMAVQTAAWLFAVAALSVMVVVGAHRHPVERGIEMRPATTAEVERWECQQRQAMALDNGSVPEPCEVQSEDVR